MTRKSKDDEVTSRRSFSKSVVAALVAAPLASSLAGPAAAQKQNIKTSRRVTEHDTPPPLIISQGSLVVEIDQDLRSPVISGSRKNYRRPKKHDDADFAHIKILDGSGDLLYRNDSAKNCDIVLTLEGIAAPELKISGGSELGIEIPRDMDLGNPSANSSATRPKKYGPSPQTIGSITVKKGPSVIFSVSKDDVASELEDVRILIWHLDHVHHRKVKAR